MEILRRENFVRKYFGIIATGKLRGEKFLGILRREIFEGKKIWRKIFWENFLGKFFRKNQIFSREKIFPSLSAVQRRDLLLSSWWICL